VSTAAIAVDPLHPQALTSVRQGRSKQALRAVPSPAVSLAIQRPRAAEPVRLNPNRRVSLALTSPVDPLLAASQMPTTQLPPLSVHTHFKQDGAGIGLDRFVMTLAPPDPSGAVGETQYVQWANAAITVFDKKPGGAVAGPIPGNALWTGFGGNCEVRNNGDPVVEYDRSAKRWFIAQFAVTDGMLTGYSECIAVSTSADATGDYWLYEFQYPAMDDYPKVGVWTDGYYVSFNMYEEYLDEHQKRQSIFLGPRACVYDRDQMLIGGPGRQLCFQLPSSFYGMLPSDADGGTPPAGVPNYFVALGRDGASLDVWRFAADWKTGTATFGRPADNSPDFVVPVAAYTLACNGNAGACVPQPHRIDGQEQLDTLGDRLMYRAAYRRFATHDALVVNHSVDIGGDTPRTGIRWYELRGMENGAPTVQQQGTFSLDSNHRWMGSAAMDGSGRIALAYNVSGAAVSPGIRAAARIGDDPPGVLRSEAALMPGSGVQTCMLKPSDCQCDDKSACLPLTRWGDYSSLTVDPVDDCTFWYSGEYLAEDGAFKWRSRIVSFDLGACPAKP
jgi:hypothetical protein